MAEGTALRSWGAATDPVLTDGLLSTGSMQNAVKDHPEQGQVLHTTPHNAGTTWHQEPQQHKNMPRLTTADYFSHETQGNMEGSPHEIHVQVLTTKDRMDTGDCEAQRP